MNIPYDKKFKTVQQQLETLIERGMVFSDLDFAKHALSRIGYYRLSGYSYPYREWVDVDRSHKVRGDDFIKNTSFDEVLSLYEFDRALRLHVFDAIELFEVSMRFQIGHRLGELGAFSHINPSLLSEDFTQISDSTNENSANATWLGSDHALWLKKVNQKQAQSKEEFVKHFKTKYGGPLPIWVVTEILDFGNLSHLFNGMNQQDRDAIARKLGLIDRSGAGRGSTMANWMRHLNYIRNVCAHHSRLWNLNITDQLASAALDTNELLSHIYFEQIHKSKLKMKSPAIATDRLYGTLAVLAYLTFEIEKSFRWRNELIEILTKMPNSRNLLEIGFPEDWQEKLLWTRG